jgi:two-component system LytT family response regulator
MIVDDEAPARALIREYLGAARDVTIVAECANGYEAVKAIGQTPPDLVFLDIQMPKLDGFEVLELIAPVPAVIFCTAYDEHALRAFEVHAVDYLLKPFGRERFVEALARARQRLLAATGAGSAPVPALPSPAALAASARPPDRWLERVIVRDGPHVHVIPADTIDLIEAQDDYVAVHAGGKSWLKHQSLAELAQALDPARFVRIHRSYVIALDRLTRLERMTPESHVAILANGRELPVSRAGHARLRELMKR